MIHSVNIFIQGYYETEEREECPCECRQGSADRHQVALLLFSLIHQPVTFALEQYQGLVLTSPEIQGLIRAETDSQLLSFFREEASFFKGLGRVENLAEDELRKRLVWI